MENNQMTLEQARQVLKDAGYYVDFLLNINLVKAINPSISDVDARDVLDIVMNSEQVTDIIWKGITEQLQPTTL